ncbi:MAG: hypothetical protein ABIR87_05395 [Sphingomicrobium sp.]
MRVILTVSVLLSSTSPVFAAGNAQSGATVGDCISDGLYGNEPNVLVGTGGPAEQAPGSKGGNIVPTQSPGPFVNNPTDPDNPTRGRSVGRFMQDGIDIPAICRTAFQ